MGVRTLSLSHSYICVCVFILVVLAKLFQRKNKHHNVFITNPLILAGAIAMEVITCKLVIQVFEAVTLLMDDAILIYSYHTGLYC